MKKNKKLKIAFVSDAIYPYNKGGKEKRIHEITTRLAKAGYQVTIYCMKWWKGKENDHRENGVNLHAISSLYPLYSGKRRSIRQAIFFALSCFQLLKEDFDIIDVDHMPHLILFPLKIVSLIKRKPLYTTWNEVWGRKYWQEYLGKLGTIAWMAEWLSARMPDKIIAVSEHTKNKLRKDLQVKQQIFVIPNGIDIEIIEGVKPAKQKSDIIFAGRLLSHKNVATLVKSIKIVKSQYPNVKTLIIGDGPEKNTIEKLIKENNLEKNILLLGFLKNHTDLYALMKSSKVFVFPSTREGFGIVALEANASGIPVVTTNHPDNATKDLITDGMNGYKVELNEKKFAKTITTYLASGKDRTKYMQSVRQYNWKSLAHRVEEAYFQ